MRLPSFTGLLLDCMRVPLLVITKVLSHMNSNLPKYEEDFFYCYARFPFLFSLILTLCSPQQLSLLSAEFYLSTQKDALKMAVEEKVFAADDIFCIL
jgi:hypothetical protein